MQLAEINIARLKKPLDHPQTAGFTNNLDRINDVAERSEGFVWRYTDESGNATDTQIADDPLVIVNVSVWESIEALETFVFGTIHRQFYARRDEWFNTLQSMHFAMWWVEDGTQPTIEEAMERLQHYEAVGSSDQAFGWDYIPAISKWRTARCSAA